jgi:hypothetical protein
VESPIPPMRPVRTVDVLEPGGRVRVWRTIHWGSWLYGAVAGVLVAVVDDVRWKATIVIVSAVLMGCEEWWTRHRRKAPR